MRPASVLAGAVTLGSTGAALARPATVISERPARPAVESPEVTDLAWLTGHWSGPGLGGRAEEHWLAPTDGSMSAQFRLVREGVAVMYELLLIEQDDDGEIYYRFKHVGPGWTPWEETRLEYRLTELEGRKATFRSTADAPQPNAPWWFTYESPSDDRLVVSIYGPEGDAPSARLSMTRQ